MTREIDYLEPNKLIIVGLDTDDGVEHPLYDERISLALSEPLVRNILVYGIQQPVIVRQEAGKHFVVDGRQRVRAAREAYRRQGDAGEHQILVPVRIVKADDSRVAGIMVSTNEIRQEDEVLAKALKATRLMDMLGDENEVAIAFGRSVQTIKHWLKLVEAIPEIHDAIRAGKITASVGVELAYYVREQQAEMLERVTRQKPESMRTSKPAEDAAETEEDEAEDVEAENTAEEIVPKKVSSTKVRQERQSAQGMKKEHKGIKRSWLRAALKTPAAKKLTDEQHAILAWFATGEAEKDTWFDQFVWDADSDLVEEKTEKLKAKAVPKATKTAPAIGKPLVGEADSTEASE